MSDLTKTIRRPVLKISTDQHGWEEDEIVTEYPLTIFLNDEEFATIVCTPADLEEMVIGFLAAEGAIKQYAEIKQLTIDEGQGFAYVDLHQETILSQSFYSKRRITSCCGKSRQSFYFFSDARTAKAVEEGITVTPVQCMSLMKDLQSSSGIHRQTGGVHNAALCTPDGVVLQYSDIGRHNALDKIYGECLRKNISTEDKILVFSGRISSEVLLKAAKIGASIILSKSAPTELALQLAEELNITAVGFIRNDKMNVYTNAQRILLDA
ncbi:formate dehydrogenase accessory sulfurtransferase FdhD [Brevibacillus invocatus]|uniref:formate dehydrogenase accessory sulfurtransferase FdhD n=1 Tax=Brevibacillus invocatus TaxID=173959 RepID=UPI00203EA662|nr:formate dehydrogenase accessory sulfurtransferase FdhD [Brevibacillus invocatus]MCM3081148.1 formate dehydrogenase accessory sulfurtransferase FdhD [Brevibacillus invocatus]MCM3431439.1 formate dehydrogenase accessory sulfurtransferase FdhD [Brevibacillus invocatus]